MSRSLKIKALILFFLLLGGGLFAPLFFLDAEKLRVRFITEVSSILGEKVEIETAQMTYFPQPTLNFKGIKIAEWLKAESLQIDLGFFGYFNQNLSAKTLSLENALIDEFIFDAKAVEKFKLIKRLDSAPLFGDIHLINSHLSLKLFEQSYSLQAFNGVLAWHNTHHPFRLKGEAAFKDKPLKINLEVKKPLNVLEKQKNSPLTLEMKQGDVKTDFSGTLNLVGALKANGQLTLNSGLQTVKSFVEFKNQQLELSSVKLNGMIEGQGHLSYSQIKNEITGNLSLNEVHLPSFKSLTLINASQFVSVMPQGELTEFAEKIDLRISIKNIFTSPHEFQNFKAIVIKNKGQLTLNSVSFNQNDAEFKGEVSVQNNEILGALNGKNFNFINMPLEKKIEGVGDFQAKFIANDLTFPYQMSVTFTIYDGKLHYGNLEERVLEIARRPLSRHQNTALKGVTAFKQLKGQITFDARLWSLTEPLFLENDRFRIEADGGGQNDQIMLPCSIHVKLIKADFPCQVNGTQKEPRISFAPKDIISRSKAAAPLREGGRDERAAQRVLDAMQRQSPHLTLPDELIKPPHLFRLP